MNNLAQAASEPEFIAIHGAREHNLKNISLAIPRNQFVVVTGVSGSGKSTLAFDLLFAEGQRRFLDSMNVYARQFVEQLPRPEVDLITGIPPTVSIEQRQSRGGGKSTVATVTEIYHFLRLLFARLGTQFCPRCQLPVQAQTRDEAGPAVGGGNETARRPCSCWRPWSRIAKASTPMSPNGPPNTATPKSGPTGKSMPHPSRCAWTASANTTWKSWWASWIRRAGARARDKSRRMN